MIFLFLCYLREI